MINSKNKIHQGGGRIEYIDLAKGFCIILVVLFHCDIYFYHIGYEFNTMVGNTFRMPLYYFLSGLFFKPYNGFFNFAIRKANKLLIPFLFLYRSDCTIHSTRIKCRYGNQVCHRMA